SPELETKADAKPFRNLFRQMSKGDAGVFPNLGGDALMILPSPVDEDSPYSHLLTFLRAAPSDQVHKFWQLVGDSLSARISNTPVWLSTAGGGVSWLHARLDDKPKYYVYGPYRDA
ncbi:MAG: DUF6940 family protein, partial [bacterium]